MTYEQAVRKAAHRDWGAPAVAAALGIQWHDWTQFQNGSYNPTALQWIHLGRRYDVEVPGELIDQWRAERPAG
jgi:hypothetical protein